MKILIAIPSHGDWKMEFGMSLLLMTTYAMVKTPAKNLQINPRVQMGSLICSQRQELVKEALEWGADYILWLDDDMGFPRDTLHRLLLANKDIIAANCPKKELPSKWTAKNLGSLVNSSDKTGLQEVDSVGCAVMLVKTDVYRNIDLPYFEIGFDRVAGGFVGEDVYFCRKARSNGYEIYIDHDLSKEITHVGNFRYECFSDETMEKIFKMVE